MNKAIITLTKGGAELGLRLLDQLDQADLYIHEKFMIEKVHVKKIDEKMGEFVGTLFDQYKCLIFIMATGIVVRAIAPYLKDKRKDPAVIVLDEKGKNVISLLSGHIGGANAYTVEIANILEANPVITTASDVNHSMAVDTLAMALNCEIEDFKQATKVTAHIVNGEKVGLVSDVFVDIALPKNLVRINSRNTKKGFKGLIYITEKIIKDHKEIDRVILRPKNIIIGIGCRRGKSKDEILKFIEDTLTSLQLSQKSIKHIATVDIKKDEIGIIEAAKALDVPLVIIARDKIKEIENKFELSSFVKKTIGVGAVCEPVAFLSSSSGEMIQRKKKDDGVTIAVFREGEHKNGNHCSRD
ncbi:cobalt-precorrin 5A hydrolase [Marinisporobacter balticus]|uniref:Cobalt-precorrin 5A acetaldehyde-lyase n=1 Tax=Marinisporobacter balticus TaxID=2018667 RepID=A0A4R2KZW4_9FIRM|nr:cobalt-precorrin 5A hydrolase [Marinisporobacter balticus]TCO79493.1 cobalt-precorrin 5A acetaldehyde-lyase [Marinisporobacter balticus]